MVTLWDSSTESATEEDCLAVSWGKLGNFVQPGVFPIPADSPILILYITGLSEVCRFQVSYSAFQDPLSLVVQSQPYSFTLKEGETAYFAYSHNFDNSFRVTTYLANGDISLSVTPVNKVSLQELIKAGPSSFPIVPSRNDADVVVNQESPHFCKSCSYLIAVSSRLGAQGEVMVSKPSDGLPLSVKGVMRDKLRVEEVSARNYTFSSISNFNISLVVIYGVVKLTVINPRGQVVSEAEVDGSTSIHIAVDPLAREAVTYTVRLQSEGDASYSIRASRVNVTKRLFPGIPERFALSKEKAITF